MRTDRPSEKSPSKFFERKMRLKYDDQGVRRGHLPEKVMYDTDPPPSFHADLSLWALVTGMIESIGIVFDTLQFWICLCTPIMSIGVGVELRMGLSVSILSPVASDTNISVYY